MDIWYFLQQSNLLFLISLSFLSSSQLMECDAVKLDHISLMKSDTSNGVLNERRGEECLCLQLSQSPSLRQNVITAFSSKS